MNEADPQPTAQQQADEDAQPWLRLDKRMLLVHPVNEVVRLLPVLLVSLILGSQSGNHYYSVVILAVLVAAALMRWFTTTYRIGPVHVQLRTGLVQKKVLSVPRSRIRSVDVQSRVLHRLLGLSILQVGTGQKSTKKSEKFVLDALDAGLVPALRDELMRAPTTDASAPVDMAAELPVADQHEIAHFRPSWVRYAPFSATGIVIVAVAAGLVMQSGVGTAVAQSDAFGTGIDDLVALGIAASVVIGAVALLVVSSILAVGRYLLVYGNLTVTDDGDRLRVGHGLLSTRHTTLDRDRLRGVSLRRPLALRIAGGAKLDAVMTGVSDSEKESSLLLPSAPLRNAHETMESVLTQDRSLIDACAAELVGHGPVALRRRLIRATVPILALFVPAAVVALTIGGVPWFVWAALVGALACSIALGVDRYRGLGHVAREGVLITQHGSLDRRRVVLAADGIIGWTVSQTYFQRRAGVATVMAATAAGAGHYEVLDVPVEKAWSIVVAVQPTAGDIWIRT